MDFLPIVFLLFGVASAYYMFSDVFGSSDKVDSRPPPKSQAERRERREEREQKLKAEYEEKKALKLKVRNEKNKIYQDKKENEKREVEKLAENQRILKEEKKRIVKERKLNFINWFKPNKTMKSGIITPKRNTVERPQNSFFGSENKEPNTLEEKLDNLAKELKDL